METILRGDLRRALDRRTRHRRPLEQLLVVLDQVLPAEQSAVVCMSS